MYVMLSCKSPIQSGLVGRNTNVLFCFVYLHFFFPFLAVVSICEELSSWVTASAMSWPRANWHTRLTQEH